jgi:hypothetical protein
VAQSSPRAADRAAMYSLMACQNEAAPCGSINASRLTALLSAASTARCAAGLNFTCSRSSLIRSSAVISLVASNSEDRARNRSASKHVSKLMSEFHSCGASCPRQPNRVCCKANLSHNDGRRHEHQGSPHVKPGSHSVRVHHDCAGYSLQPVGEVSDCELNGCERKSYSESCGEKSRLGGTQWQWQSHPNGLSTQA